MANEKQLKVAKEAYETLCSTLDSMKFNYKRDDDKLMVFFGVSGEDIPMEFIVHCDADRQIIRLMSFLPFKMNEDKRIDGAVATCQVNYLLADGSFDYNVGDGTIIFRMTSSFRASLVGTELFKYMFQVAWSTVDKYNDQFMMISN